MDTVRFVEVQNEIWRFRHPKFIRGMQAFWSCLVPFLLVAVGFAFANVVAYPGYWHWIYG